MSLWSVIVYSRTYEADYRFLAIPADFTPEDEKWAISYIKATTRKAEQLPGNPRWSLFKNQKYCVIGVTCMVKDLIGSQDRTVDKGERPIYAFVGYVAKVDKTQKLYLDIPPYADNISLFKTAYNSVKDQWLVKAYDLRIKPQTPRFQYSPILLGRNRTNSKIEPYFFLNIEDSQVRLWPNSHQTKWGIWESACFFVDFYKSVSLCLGMSLEKDVLESPFCNGTVGSVNYPLILKRVSVKVKSDINKRKKRRYHKRINLYKERILGSLIGVFLWGAIFFKWMVIAIIIGGIIGWIVVVLLQQYRSYRINKTLPFIPIGLKISKLIKKTR